MGSSWWCLVCKRIQISLGLLLHSSNCVINLAPDKRAVLREAFRVLKVMMGWCPWQQSRLGVALFLECH